MKDLLEALATAQRLTAVALHDAAGIAAGHGMTWREIGEATGLPRETAFRQYRGGNMIVVVRPRHAGRKPRPGAEGGR